MFQCYVGTLLSIRGAMGRLCSSSSVGRSYSENATSQFMPGDMRRRFVSDLVCRGMIISLAIDFLRSYKVVSFCEAVRSTSALKDTTLSRGLHTHPLRRT